MRDLEQANLDVTIKDLEAFLFRCLMHHYLFDETLKEVIPLSDKAKPAVEFLRWDVLGIVSTDIKKKKERIKHLYTLIEEVS